MADHEKGRVVKTTRRKVAAALDEWLTRIEHSIKPSMAQNWRNYANYYVIPYIGERDVQEIDGGGLRRAVCEAARRRPRQGQAEDGTAEATPFTCAGVTARWQGPAVPTLPV